jgi:hypothetical protein
MKSRFGLLRAGVAMALVLAVLIVAGDAATAPTKSAPAPSASGSAPAAPAAATENKPTVEGLLKETQRTLSSSGEIRLVWWIPTEFFLLSAASGGKVNPADIEDMRATVDPYVLVAVLNGRIGSTGSTAWRSEADTRETLRLVDASGATYQPLAEEDLSPELRTFLGIMKPFMVNMMGSMGKNLNFFAFAAKDAKGQRIADAKHEGSFAIRLGETDYRWRLPLGSLLPSKTCPKCKESCSGAWKFCPWDGTLLPTPPTPPKAADPPPAVPPAKKGKAPTKTA